jgi:hypothetical protein
MGLGTGATLAITAGIGAAGSIGSSLINANAAGDAAQQQETAQQKVMDLANSTVPAANTDIQTGATNANSTLQNQLGVDTAGLSPYTQSGTSALAQLNKLTASGGFQAPTAAQAEATPGYQFQLQQGEQAQAQAAAAMGQSMSGGEIKAADAYAQGIASTNYGNTYNQALSTYGTNLGALQNLTATGLNATNTGISAGSALSGEAASNTMQGGLASSSNLMTGLGINAGALTGIGNAAAAGTIGTANAYSSGLGGVANAATGYGNNISQMSMLQSILGTNGGGMGTYSPALTQNTGQIAPLPSA